MPPARRAGSEGEAPEIHVEDYFPSGTFRSAQRLVDAGRSREAVDLLSRLLRRHPDSPQGNQARYLLGLSLLRLGEYGQAARLFEELVTSYPELRDDHLFYRGESLYLLGHYLQAASVLAEVQASSARGLPAARLRAWALYRSTDFERLVLWLEAELRAEADGLDPELLLVLGKARKRNGDPLGAHRAFREVWQRAPTGRLSGQALVELATVAPRARSALRPAEAAAILRLRPRIIAEESFDDAMARLERRLVTVGGSRALRAEVAAARGRIATRSNRLPAALVHFRRAAALAPVEFVTLRASVSLAEAHTRLRLGQESPALAAFERVASRFEGRPEAEDALLQGADILLRIRRYAAAEARCADLLASWPESRYRAECLWNSGWAKFRLGEFEEAERHFEALAALEPMAELDAAATYWLGRTKAMVGKSQEAQEAFARVLRRYPMNYYAALADDQLVMPLESFGAGSAGSSGGVGGAFGEARRATALPKSLEQVAEYMRLGLRDKAATALLSFDRTAEAEQMKLPESALQMMTRTYGALRMFDDARRLRERCAREYPRPLADPESLRIAQQAHPLKYEQEIRRAAKEFGLSESLLFALVRTESGFKADAVSSMNAYGLSQLLLPTANMMASKIRAGPVTRARLLYNPGLNVRLGAAYLRSMLDRYDGMEPLAIAAYNAGPAAVDAWARRRVRGVASVRGGGLGVAAAPDELAEEITVAETRAFVKVVLARARGYAVLYGAGVPNASPKRLPELPPALLSGPLSEPIDVPSAADLSRARRVGAAEPAARGATPASPNRTRRPAGDTDRM